MIITIKNYCDIFAQNKDVAKALREDYIYPAIKKGDLPIVLDFLDVDSSTQSFVHALVSGIFQEYGEKTLEMFEFKNCNKAIVSLITTVINYSLE